MGNLHKYAALLLTMLGFGVRQLLIRAGQAYFRGRKLEIVIAYGAGRSLPNPTSESISGTTRDYL